jgi:GT2 family glycosyltransferase
VASSSGDILAFIDADCLADPGWLAAAEAAIADPSATILGGDVRIALADPACPTMAEAYESLYAYRMDRYIAREGFTGTGNLVVRRAVLQDVGPFAGIAVAEDRDWGRRATAKGYRIRFLPQMRVYHPARATFEDLARPRSRRSSGRMGGNNPLWPCLNPEEDSPVWAIRGKDHRRRSWVSRVRGLGEYSGIFGSGA